MMPVAPVCQARRLLLKWVTVDARLAEEDSSAIEQ
jgi:hypothetical protein